jgi:succinate-semialdehyde dehydrogenase/glutarate-semialdehyde dehydrogenase
MASVLRANKAAYSRRITEEMGKPLVEAEGEIEVCVELRLLRR